MNALESYIAGNKLNESEVMNVLQEESIISDNCVCAQDVVDDENAVRWLKHRATQG